jgi:hypothetical protein
MFKLYELNGWVNDESFHIYACSTDDELIVVDNRYVFLTVRNDELIFLNNDDLRMSLHLRFKQISIHQPWKI